MAAAAGDTAVTVAVITAALALLGTVVAAVIAVVNAFLARVAKWHEYKRGLYKGLLELVAVLKGASAADAERLEREYRAQRLQARLVAGTAVQERLQALTFEEAKKIDEDSETYNELVALMRADI